MVNPTVSLIGIRNEPECSVDINQEIGNCHSTVAMLLNLAHKNLVTKPAAERHLPTRDRQIGRIAQYSRLIAILSTPEKATDVIAHAGFGNRICQSEVATRW
jgi:hypothetical protein